MGLLAVVFIWENDLLHAFHNKSDFILLLSYPDLDELPLVC